MNSLRKELCEARELQDIVMYEDMSIAELFTYNSS